MNKFILSHDFNGNIYYVRVRQDGWDEVYNPGVATEFKTKKEAVDWSRENTTFGEYAVGLSKDKEVEKFKEWSELGMIRREFKLLDKTISRKYNNESNLEVLEWHLNKTDEIRFEDYKTWPNLYSVFSNLWDVETYQDKTLSFSMYVRPDSTFDKFKEELELVLQHITRLEDGYKVISVFDRFCGAGGNFATFEYKSDDDCKLCSRWNEITTGNLQEVFKVWKEDRYYE